MSQKKLIFIMFIILSLTATLGFIFIRKQQMERLYSSHIFPMLLEIPILGAVVYYNFLPSDYYSPLVQFPLEEGEKNLKFSCKYKGRHLIRIKYISSDLLYNSGVRLTGKIARTNGMSCVEFDVPDSRLFVRYGDGDRYRYNYHYVVFRAPYDVPLDEPLVLKIKCSGDVENLLRVNPDSMIELAKDFDK